MGKRRKIEIDTEWNGIPYKLIICKNEKGDVEKLMEKPKFKLFDNTIHVSGCHRFANQPEEDHFDHYWDGKHWRERPDTGRQLDFPYFINGPWVRLNYGWRLARK